MTERDAKQTIVIGHAALDHVFRIAEFPERPTKVRSLEHFEGGGGSAANAAVAIARLGGTVEFWSRVGDDETGQRIRAGLEQERVNTESVLIHKGSRSSESAVIVDKNGERLIVSERDHAMPPDPAWLPLAHISEASVVLSDLRWLEATAAAFKEARKYGVRTLLDIDIGFGPELTKYLALTDYAIFSAPALAAAFSSGREHDRLGRVLVLGATHAGVTKGSDGYSWRARDGAAGHQPAFRVHVVDSTGTGDAFHGAFAWALSEGFDDETCALLAAATAAMKCRQLGTRQALPNRAELENFLASNLSGLSVLTKG